MLPCRARNFRNTSSSNRSTCSSFKPPTRSTTLRIRASPPGSKNRVMTRRISLVKVTGSRRTFNAARPPLRFVDLITIVYHNLPSCRTSAIHAEKGGTNAAGGQRGPVDGGRRGRYAGGVNGAAIGDGEESRSRIHFPSPWRPRKEQQSDFPRLVLKYWRNSNGIPRQTSRTANEYNRWYSAACRHRAFPIRQHGLGSSVCS